MLLNKYYVIVTQIKITSLSFSVSRAGSTQSGGVRERRGVGNTKNSVPFPRGVHAARQKHAPCVECVRNLLSNTTDGVKSNVNRIVCTLNLGSCDA